MNLDLENKVALVTAASRGLGKASASALAREGARVAICSHSDAIEAAAGEIEGQSGSRPLALRADLTSQADIEAAVEATVRQYGRLDILVVNNGGPPPGSFLTLSPSDWESAVQLTLMSAVRLCYAAVPHMVAQGAGSIVAIQSYTVKQPVDNLILSNSLRMAVIGMLKSMAEELGPKGIRVNSINPTLTYTDRIDQLMKDRAETAGTSVEIEIEKAIGSIPLGRMGTPEEFGRTVAWLASPAASYIHGHALMFDGGAVKTAL